VLKAAVNFGICFFKLITSVNIKTHKLPRESNGPLNMNHTIQINHQLGATISPVYYVDVYLRLNMFRATPRPSSGAQQLQ
jgi:hypothetical protein